MTRPSRRHAVVVGIDHYSSDQESGASYPRLAGCAHDARRVADLLTAELDVAAEHLDLVTSGPCSSGRPEVLPTYERLVAAFGAVLERARPGDGVWIHYSGHGGRTPTSFPEIRGHAGIDEALVPADIALPGSSYLRDVEVSFLLEQLVRHGLFVTLVLDCCHSGGMTREDLPALPAPRPRANEIDDWRRSRPSLVSTREDLIASWRRFGAPWRAASSRIEDPASHHRKAGFVLLAACRPHERAYEYDITPGKAGGAFTTALVEAVHELGPDCTHRHLFERIRSSLRVRLDGFQTPQLEGEGDRRLLGGEATPSARGVTVLAVEPEQVLLATGEAHGVTEGARFVLVPLVGDPAGEGAADSLPQVVEVVDAGGGESWARWIERGEHAAAPGDRAMPADFAGLRCPVAFRSRDRDLDRRFDRLARETAGLTSPFLRWAEFEGEAETGYAVAVAGSAEVVVLTGGGDPPLHPVPPRRLDELRSTSLLAMLEHLARYRAVGLLLNGDASSPLHGTLAVDIGSLPGGFRADLDPVEPVASLGTAPTVPAGNWIALSLKNQGDRFLEIAVLDMGPDWGIAQVYPARGDSLTLEPGATELLPLHTRLSPGSHSHHHRLRVFATVDAVRWQWLALPPLGGLASTLRSGLPRNDLEQALDAFLRGVTTQGSAVRSLRAHREWTVADVTIEIQ